jgi:hypothetical protein
MRRLAPLLALAASSCSGYGTFPPPDQCGSFSGLTCLTVAFDLCHCTDQQTAFDQLQITSSTPGFLPTPTVVTPQTPLRDPIAPPVAFALLPVKTFTGAFQIHVAAFEKGGSLLSDDLSGTIDQVGQHLTVGGKGACLCSGNGCIMGESYCSYTRMCCPNAMCCMPTGCVPTVNGSCGSPPDGG